jgi:hypothetical protein
VIYRRYAIIDAGALRDAAERIDRVAGLIPSGGKGEDEGGNSPCLCPRRCPTRTKEHRAVI